MHYELVADNDEEQKLIESNKQLRVFMDVYLPVIQGRAIMEGVHLGLFRTIEHNQLTLKEISEKLSLNYDALGLLLNTLVCAGYLEYENEKFFLTELSKNSLLKDSMFQATGAIKLSRTRWTMLEELGNSIKTGESVNLHEKFLSTQESWDAYQRAMYEFAIFTADEIASCITLKPDATKMLDIGGSHGLFGAKICRKFPPLKSIVFDLPKAVEGSIPLAQEAGIDDVVSFQSGDALKDDLGKNYDLVLVSNLCHHFSKEQNAYFFCKIFSALKKGGTIAIIDIKPPDFVNNRNLTSAVSSLMFMLNSGGQNHSSSDFINWAESAGFEQVEINSKYVGKNQFLITGIK